MCDGCNMMNLFGVYARTAELLRLVEAKLDRYPTAPAITNPTMHQVAIPLLSGSSAHCVSSNYSSYILQKGALAPQFLKLHALCFAKNTCQPYVYMFRP